MMTTETTIPDPKRNELFTLDADLDGKDLFPVEGSELVQMVTDHMNFSGAFAPEQYPATVDEAIEYLMYDLGVDVFHYEVTTTKVLTTPRS